MLRNRAKLVNNYRGEKEKRKQDNKKEPLDYNREKTKLIKTKCSSIIIAPSKLIQMLATYKQCGTAN